jgi:hypothetical protein
MINVTTYGLLLVSNNLPVLESFFGIQIKLDSSIEAVVEYIQLNIRLRPMKNPK